jgi:uncharacterized membrane protein YfcA
VRALLASPLAILIGWSLGALGGGGSILALPVLVYAAGQEPRAATATSLILVAISASIALVPHARAGRVQRRAGLVFAGAGIPAALLGGWLAHDLNPDLLLLLFAPIMATAAFAMLRSSGAPAATRRSWRIPGCIVVGIVGFGVGLLTGVFGVGGGFVIVPALVLALRTPMPDAVGTSLLVIVVNSLVALSTRLHADTVEWGVVVPFVAAALIGVYIGTRTAARLPAERLRTAFAWLLLAVALFTATRSGFDLAAA